MVHSWSSNITTTPQESQGIEIIRSIFHSINVNQRKLPNSLTYSKLKSTKSLNKIVIDVSNRLQFNSKARSKFYSKNSYPKKNIKLKNNVTPAFQDSDNRSSNIIKGNSFSNESIDAKISSDKVDLLWINDPKKFKSPNEKINSSINKYPTRTSVPFNQRRLEEIRQYVEHILIQEDNKSFNKLPVKVNASEDEFLLDINASQQNKNEKFNQINLSINNYYQSSDLSHEKIEQQNSSNAIIIDRQKTFCCKKEIQTSFIKNKNISKPKAELNIINNSSSSKYSEPIKNKQQQAVDNIIDKRRNNSKSNSLSAVLTGQFKTAAKPSQMLIPQNSRGRALFQSFMHMNDLPEEHETKSNKFKSSPENLKSFKLKNLKNNNLMSLNRKSWSSSKTSQQNILYDSEKLKLQNKKDTSQDKNSPPGRLLRSKTFIAENKLDLLVNEEMNSKIKTDEVILKEHDYSERINARDIKKSKYSLILEEKSSEEDYSCELIKVNKTSKNNSNNKLNNLSAKNSKMIDLLNDNKINEINLNIASLEDNKSDRVDTFTETQWFSKLSKADTFTKTDFSINPLDRINACTETDLIKYRSTSVNVKTSCDNLMSTNKTASKVFIDAEVFCNIPLIDTTKEQSFADLLGPKSYCIVDSQTSETLLLKYFFKEKKDASIETIKSEYQSKDTNTNRVILIDTATGKDRFDIQNFNCDTQSINTDYNVFEIPSENRIATHDFECQVGESTAASVMSFEQAVSNLSSELISSQKSLLESTSKLSDCDIVKSVSFNDIPIDLIRAFKIASERAQNLYQAYKIYQEYQQNNPNSDNNLAENSREKIPLNASECEEIKSSDFIEKKISNSQTKEIKFTIQNLLDMAEEKVINENKLQSDENERFSNNSSSLLLSLSSSSSFITENVNLSMDSVISRKAILPIIYGALCSFIFWSLQFSAYYETH